MKCLIANFSTYFEKLFLALAIGKMVTFAFVFAPKVFTVLDRVSASELQNAVFPNYYLIALVASAFLFTKNLFQLKKKARFSKFKLAIASFYFVATLISYFYILPSLIELQSQVIVDQDQFQFLHKSSVTLHAVSLLGLLIYLAF